MSDNFNFNPYSGSSSRHIRKIDYAYQLIAQKRWAEADRILDQILDEYPTDANALAGKKLLSRELRIEAKASKPPSKMAVRRASRRAAKIVSRERYAEKMKIRDAEKAEKRAAKDAKRAERKKEKVEKAAMPKLDPTPESRSKKKTRIAAIVVAVILITGIIAAALWFSDYKKGLENEDVMPQSSAVSRLTE